MPLDLFPVTPTGKPGYKVVDSHAELNGKFGGFQTWVVHYQPTYGHGHEELELYMHVGNYYEVGSCSGRVSRWQVVGAAVELVKEGATPARLLRLTWLALKFGLRL